MRQFEPSIKKRQGSGGKKTLTAIFDYSSANLQAVTPSQIQITGTTKKVPTIQQVQQQNQQVLVGSVKLQHPVLANLKQDKTNVVNVELISQQMIQSPVLPQSPLAKARIMKNMQGTAKAKMGQPYLLDQQPN